MSITDELRERAHGFNAPNEEMLLAIADRIDAEHERLMQEQPFTINMVPITDESMAEHGWIRLPVDADGEYIHIGDVMDFTANVRDLVVLGIGMVDVGGERDMGVFVLRGREYEWYNASFLHHHVPTVEDVLLDACKAYHSLMVESTSDVAHDMPAPSEVIAEYAAKLRLAEGEDA